MATLLDTTLLAFFAPLFIFLFVFAVIYALLQKSQIFGENQKTLDLIAAVSVAAVSVFIGGTTFVGLIASVVPWIVFIFIIFVLLFSFYMFFGLEKEEVWDIVCQS